MPDTYTCSCRSAAHDPGCFMIEPVKAIGPSSAHSVAIRFTHLACGAVQEWNFCPKCGADLRPKDAVAIEKPL